MARLEEILERNNKKYADFSEETSSKFISKNARLMKMGAIHDTKFEPENIPLTNEIDVIILHANEINKNKMIRKPTVMQIKSSADNVHKDRDHSHDETTSREHSHMYNHTQTQNLVFIERKVDDQGREVEFDQDFILCTVFGYKNVYIKDGDDIYEIFIPVKRKDYNEQHEFTRNLLNGYRSASDFSQYSSSSEEVKNTAKSSHRKVSYDAPRNSIITPRGIIRRETTKNINRLSVAKPVNFDEDMIGGSGKIVLKKNVNSLEAPENEFGKKRKSDFDMIMKNPQKDSNKFIKKLMSPNKIRKKRGSASPHLSIKRKNSFKRTKYRFAGRRTSTNEIEFGSKSIDEEPNNLSTHSIRQRKQNLSLQKLISEDPGDNVSASVRSNQKYIDKLKGTYLKAGLLGKILNLQIKKKIGVQFIEQNDIIQEVKDNKIHMITASPRFTDEPSKRSVSDSSSNTSEVQFNTEEESCSDDDESKEKSSSVSSNSRKKSTLRKNVPGVFIHKLDSKSVSSATAEEFKREVTPEQKIFDISPISRSNNMLNTTSIWNHRKTQNCPDIPIERLKLNRRITQQYKLKRNNKESMGISVGNPDDSPDRVQSQREIFILHSKRTAMKRRRRIIKRPKKAFNISKSPNRIDKDFYKILFY